MNYQHVLTSLSLHFHRFMTCKIRRNKFKVCSKSLCQEPLVVYANGLQFYDIFKPSIYLRCQHIREQWSVQVNVAFCWVTKSDIYIKYRHLWHKMVVSPFFHVNNQVYGTMIIFFTKNYNVYFKMSSFQENTVTGVTEKDTLSDVFNQQKN